MSVPSGRGVDGFIADLGGQRVEATLTGNIVVYHLTPASGALVGRSVPTGVEVGELQGWPAIPPHWIHLPEEIHFASTNVDRQDVLEGWQRHSRDIGVWDMARRPVLNWIAHVRGVIGQAA